MGDIIENLDWDDNQKDKNNSPLLPKSIRGLIVGKSGCGKTNLLINLLLKEGWLDYDKLFVFGKSLFQPKYKIIKSGFEHNLPKCKILELFRDSHAITKQNVPIADVMNELAKQNAKKGEVKDCCFFEDSTDMPDPKDLNSTNKNLMIFDDILLEKQNKCEDYYTRGRHSNVDCFYLSQNYFKLPRQTIRENSNFIILFKQDLKNITHIFNDHASCDMTFDEFRKLCNKCWQVPYGFLTIDKNSEIFDGRYRSNFHRFYYTDEDIENLKNILKNVN